MPQDKDLLQRLGELDDVGIALSSERDINLLMENILVSAKHITHADAGTLYLLEPEQQLLKFEVLRNDSLGIAMGGSTGAPVSHPFYPIHLVGKDGKPNHKMVAAHAALSGETFNITDAYTAEGYDFSGTRDFDQKTGYRSTSFLTVPMRDHESKIIGVLQLINALDRSSGAIVSFSKEDQHLAESLASQAAIALTNRRLIEKLDSQLQRMSELNDIGIALSSERNIDRLMENILISAKHITHADAGTLYLLEPEQQVLRFEVLRNDSLGLEMGGCTGKPVSHPFYPIHLTDKNGKPNHGMVAAHAALSGETFNIPDAYSAEGYDFSGTRDFDQKTGYRSVSFLTVPMCDHENKIIGVLQLINALDRHKGTVIPFTKEDQRMAESLASQAAVAITNRRLIKQLENLASR